MLRSSELLQKAVMEGNLLAVQSYINNNVHLDDNTGNGFNTPLHLAAERGHESIALALIGAGCKLDVANRDGKKPLHIATFKGLTDVVKALIESQCDVAALDGDGSTALHLAARKGWEAIAAMLIDAGCPLDVKDSLDDTPLLVAVSFRRSEVAKLLISAGCDVNICSERGIPLMLALDQPAVLAALLSSPRCYHGISDREGNTAMHLAAFYGNAYALSKLIATGRFELEATNTRGLSPLYIAAFPTNNKVSTKTSMGMVKMLVAAGCKLVVARQLMLHCACSFDRPDLVAYCIELGQDVNAVCEGDTPLRIATTNNNVTIIRLLLTAGAFVTHPQRSLLHLACLCKFNTVIQILLDHGFDRDELDRGKSIIDCALEHKSEGTLSILASEGIYREI